MKFIVLLIILFLLFGCAAIPYRIGYYDGFKFINCDDTKTPDEVRICNNIEHWYGRNRK